MWPAAWDRVLVNGVLRLTFLVLLLDSLMRMPPCIPLPPKTNLLPLPRFLLGSS